MSLETYTGFIKDMVATNPTGLDPVAQGDDHLRGVKSTLKTQFIGLTEGIEITASESEINLLSGVTEIWNDALIALGGDHTASGAWTFTGAFTSLGIDDNATGRRLLVGDGFLIVGAAGQYQILHSASNQTLNISGGNSVSSGANIQLRGGTHATLANDFQIRADATNVIAYGHSATLLNLAADVRSFSNSAGTEQARFNSSGNLLINTTANNGIDKLQVNGSARAGNIPVTVGLVDITGNAVAAATQGHPYTATKTGVGTYTVTITGETNTIYLTAMVWGSAGEITVAGVGAGSVNIATYSSAGAPTDKAFSFIAWAALT